MKNWEKYEEEIKELGLNFAVLKHSNKVVDCAIESPPSCEECLFYAGNYSCDKEKVNWLYSEYKEPVVLTDDERKLCELLEGGWIARDANGNLYYFRTKPQKGVHVWHVCGVEVILDVFPQCKFDFIKWEDDEPWNVEELVK